MKETLGVSDKVKRVKEFPECTVMGSQKQRELRRAKCHAQGVEGVPLYTLQAPAPPRPSPRSAFQDPSSVS